MIGFCIRLVVATAVVCGFFIGTQDFQIFPGVIAGLQQPNSRAADELPAEVRSIFVETEDGERIEVWQLPPADRFAEESGLPIALIFHGNGEDLQSSFGLQRWLQSMGIIAFNYDYRGYGRSSGWPSDSGLKSDVKAVLGFIGEQYDLEEHPLVLVGISIGSGLASYGATLTKTDTLVLISPYTDLSSLVSDVPIFGLLSPFVWYDIDTRAYLQSLNGTCIVMAHGRNDTIIPFNHSHELATSMPSEVNLSYIEFEDTGHNDIMGKGHRRIGRGILDCLGQDRDKNA